VISDAVPLQKSNLRYSIYFKKRDYIGGILVLSMSSFQIILPLQSALVVGNNLILLILYNPTANQIAFKRMNTNLGICSSTFPEESSNLENWDLTPMMDFMGFMMDMEVMDMLIMLRLDPDMYIMNEFMRTDFPGDVASPIAALDFFLMSAAARCFSLVESSDDFVLEELVEDWRLASIAEMRFIPSGEGNF
jgi:hypothetical protein